MLTEPEFIALNAVFLKKMATAETVADVTGLPVEEVSRHFASAADQGWLIDMPPTGVMLLDEGIAQVAGYYRATYSGLRADPEIINWYDGFETLNSRFISLVSEWQKSEGDERIQRRLLQTAERLAKDIGQLLPRIARYAAYPRRLEHSMDKVDAGERDFVCKPTVDSVHNIWFEFHEDILAVLGRPRDTT